MASGCYNNAVLVGNWSEERLKTEYEFKLFLRKRERRELLLQRSRTLFSNLLKEKPLAISGMFVLFGYNVQVVASDLLVKIKEKSGKPPYGLALSILVKENQVDFMQNINHGCLMTLSPITTPCCRNTFVIVRNKSTAYSVIPAHAHEFSLDLVLMLDGPMSSYCSIYHLRAHSENENTYGEKVRYGDEFLLKAENYGDPQAAPLYVRYTPEGVPGPADRMPIRLSNVKDTNCRWTTVPLLARDRLEGLGSPIKTGAKLILKNCVADKNLCVMNQSWMQTFFGPECGVTCRNMINMHKMFTAENVFTFVSDVETTKK